MKLFRTFAAIAPALAVAAIGSAAIVPTAEAQTLRHPALQGRDWPVYVDLPTGFAFVKTPAGWKFARRLDAEQMSRLPASTFTVLLPVDTSDVQMHHIALEPSPRTLALRAQHSLFARAAGPAAVQ